MGGENLPTIIRTSPTDTADFAASVRKEWLITNGIGGYASGTVGGANTRRYHGLLIAALKPPGDRILMVSKLEEQITYKGELFQLSTNEYGDGTVAPHGYRLISGFTLEGLIPVWRYAIGDAILEKRIWMEHGVNHTYVRYELLCGTAPIQLSLSPLCSYRDYHWQQQGKNNKLQFKAQKQAVELSAEGAAMPYSIALDHGSFQASPHWHWNVKHRAESVRGLDDVEDYFCPGKFSVQLDVGAHCLASIGVSAEIPSVAAAALGRERRRQEKLLENMPDSAPDWIRTLTLAADAFVVEREIGSERQRGHSLIAGYPWFLDWTRDSMISLTGITLATGRPEMAASILKTYARYLKGGILPNRFADSDSEPEYNSVDGALWYIVAIYRYCRVTSDTAILEQLFPAISEIIESYWRGTAYNIKMDSVDNLLYAGEDGVQLTWMDAKVGGWVVTPRIGKPVEINALWYNALAIAAEAADLTGATAESKKYSKAAQICKESFAELFWYDEGEYLYDVIASPRVHGEGTFSDESLRPNQLIAIALPFELLTRERSEQVFKACCETLYTPVGMRTLAPADAKYRGEYGGDQLQRDSAYHQGTVWPWISGYFITAHLKLYKNPKQALEYLKEFEGQLSESGLGYISEIFSGNAPHRADGCIAQAWSVAEVLRVWMLCQGDDRFF